MRSRSKASHNTRVNRLKTLRQKRRRILQQLEASSQDLENSTPKKILKEQEKERAWEQDYYNLTSEISELERIMKSKRKH